MQREQSAWEITRRYFLFAMSVIISAIGIGFSIKAAVGVSPISSVPYTFALILPVITIGTWNVLWNFLQVFLQIVVRPKDIHWREIFIQTVTSCFFGYFIDVSLDMLSAYNPETYVLKIGTIVFGCCLMAIGAYFGLISNVTMLPMDALMRLVSEVYHKQYPTLRVIGDVSFTVLSGVLCIVYLGEFVGVREGTLIAALCTGNMIRFIMRHSQRLTDFLLPENILDNTNMVTMPKADIPEDNFIITVSHEYGSGGRTIARRIAHELNMPYYDSEIMEIAAEKNGYTERFVQENEERIDRSALDKFVDWYGTSYSRGNDTAQEQLFRAESEVIRDIVSKSSCVIVGRLANYILRDHENTIHIFITADDMERVNRVMRKENISEQEAATKILAFAEERRNHCHEFSELEWGNSLSYDITIKSSKYGVDRTASILIDVIEHFRNR